MDASIWFRTVCSTLTRMLFSTICVAHPSQPRSLVMATSFSTSPAGRFRSSEYGFEYASPSQQLSGPFPIRSQGRCGSRSVERSLQYPRDCFRDPLKSLSPLAARLVQEADKQTDEEVEDGDVLPIPPILGRGVDIEVAWKEAATTPACQKSDPVVSLRTWRNCHSLNKL